MKTTASRVVGGNSHQTPSAEAIGSARRNHPARLLTAAEMADCTWLRLPPPRARCPLTGLSRSGLVDLVERSSGAVRFLKLMKPGSRRGVVLLHRETLLAHLDRLAEKGGVA